MGLALIDQYSKEEFNQIVLLSTNYKEVAQKLGYTAYSGDLCNKIKERIEADKCSIEHFKLNTCIIRNEDNIFIKDSTANQSTLRRWYKKGEYTPYLCSICGQEPIWQGKELTLILDHINGSNHDDRLENLRWVCPNCNQQLDTTNGKNKKMIKKHYYCVDCGKEISRHSVRCQSCSSKAKIVPLEEMQVTREELKVMIRTIPFTQIGAKYGVSDNTIRKWCDKFNLPRKKSEIIAISDEDWTKI